MTDHPSRHTLRIQAKALTLLLATLAVTVHPALSQPLPSLDKVDGVVRGEMARQHIPGLAVAIVKDGAPVLVRGYGLANVEHDVPVIPETMFESGSLGKQFTAAAVMLQVEAGRLSLEDPINTFFPGAPVGWRAIKYGTC